MAICGLGVGFGTGTWVGDLESVVGLCVMEGLEVGRLVGRSVGSGVGSEVGPGVGLSVGLGIG